MQVLSHLGYEHHRRCSPQELPEVGIVVTSIFQMRKLKEEETWGGPYIQLASWPGFGLRLGRLKVLLNISHQLCAPTFPWCMGPSGLVDDSISLQDVSLQDIMVYLSCKGGGGVGRWDRRSLLRGSGEGTWNFKFLFLLSLARHVLVASLRITSQLGLRDTSCSVLGIAFVLGVLSSENFSSVHPQTPWCEPVRAVLSNPFWCFVPWPQVVSLHLAHMPWKMPSTQHRAENSGCYHRPNWETSWLTEQWVEHTGKSTQREVLWSHLANLNSKALKW